MMATSKENLEDCITCSVCYEKFEGRDPRFLPCGHTFCLECIKDIHKTATHSKIKKFEFRCPQCMEISMIPKNSIEKFPKFFQAVHIQDILSEYNKDLGTKCVDWSLCQDDLCEITCYCFTCNRTFCDQCPRDHSKERRFNNHVHVQVTKDTIKYLVCSVHNHMFELYCTDCFKPICVFCETIHKDHSIFEFINTQDTVHYSDTEIAKRNELCCKNLMMLITMQTKFNDHVTEVRERINALTYLNQTKLYAALKKHKADKNRDFEKIRNHQKEAQKKNAYLRQPIPELPSLRLMNLNELLDRLPPDPELAIDATRYQFEFKDYKM